MRRLAIQTIMNNNTIEIDGVKVMVCGDGVDQLPESDIQALREFIQYRKNRNKKKIKAESAD